VVKNSVLPVRPETAGVVLGVQAVVKPPPVPWQPVAQRDTITTQLALRMSD